MSEIGCRMCLLRDMDKNEYFKGIQKRIDSLDEEIKADQASYEGRLAICGACGYLRDGFCGACGCFVELRAAVAVNRCPYEKWPLNEAAASRFFNR